MSPAEHQRNRRLAHAGDELGDRQSRLDVAAHGVQQEQQTVDLLAFLYRRQQRQHVLVFCCFHGFRLNLMSLDLSDHRQDIDRAASGFHHSRAKVLDTLLRGVFLFFHSSPPSGLSLPEKSGAWLKSSHFSAILNKKRKRGIYNAV